MSSKNRYLTRPESLSETTLLEIIKTRCIELPNGKKLKKSDLVEIYKKVALPLPQRQYNEAKYFGKRLNELRKLRKISTAIEEDKKLFESTISSRNSSIDKNESSHKTSDCKRLDSSSDSNKDSSETEIKVTKSSSETNGLSKNCLKRKDSDNKVSVQTGFKKRQKITWP